MEDADAAAMAEAMGFSSFGAQQSNKRRKFNPGADAVVGSSSTATSVTQTWSNLVGGPLSSGSNSTPLGTRAQSKDEIVLDLDDGDDGQGQEGSAIRATATRDAVNDDDPGPQYVDTSRPSTLVDDEAGDDLQAKIDSIVGVSHDQQPQPPTLPVFNPGTRGGRGGGRGGYQSSYGKHRDQGDNWWEDYYDPSSNVNPWQRLEQDRGLEPRGQWMAWEEAKR